MLGRLLQGQQQNVANNTSFQLLVFGGMQFLISFPLSNREEKLTGDEYFGSLKLSRNGLSCIISSSEWT
jgi:hypothetical protein